MKTFIVPGQYHILPEAQQWAIPGSERRYWDIITVEDEEELAAYLAGQQDFIPEEKGEFEALPFGQEARAARRAPAPHRCARCERECKPQFKYCYRCNNYLKVREKARKAG